MPRARRRGRNGATPLWNATKASFPNSFAVYLASLNHLAVPKRHQQYVRTSNLVERAFVEERRRTKVIPHLWTEGSLVHLVFGVLIRVSDRLGKKCFSEFEQQQIHSLRTQLKLDEQEVSVSDPLVHVPTRRSAASAA